MRKIIAYTQRVDIVERYEERRNSSDERWAEFIHFCGYLPLPLVNHPHLAVATLEQLKPALLILTGGNNLVDYHGDAPERDATEMALIGYAIQESLPILGVCRGMQMLQHYFGGTLREVKGHTAVFHQLQLDGKTTQVNSFHNLAVLEPGEGLNALACATDGVVEAFGHHTYIIKGIMWHPEREQEFQIRDKEIINQIILRGADN